MPVGHRRALFLALAGSLGTERYVIRSTAAAFSAYAPTVLAAPDVGFCSRRGVVPTSWTHSLQPAGLLRDRSLASRNDGTVFDNSFNLDHMKIPHGETVPWLVGDANGLTGKP
jgi:hypothetical protein